MAAIATLGEAENHPTTPITALEMPIREEIPALNRRVLPRTKATFGVFIEELGQEVSGARYFVWRTHGRRRRTDLAR